MVIEISMGFLVIMGATIYLVGMFVGVEVARWKVKKELKKQGYKAEFR